ncbi:MAG: hypothetical protein ACRDRV_11430 [Pseudonocardiaceae bacterium]
MVTNNVMVRLLAGQAAEVVAVYAQAVAQADRVRALLVAAELDLDAVLVVPSLTAAGQPVVYLTGLTSPARTRLDRILHRSAGPPPQDTSPGMPERPVTDPNDDERDGKGGHGIVTWVGHAWTRSGSALSRGGQDGWSVRVTCWPSGVMVMRHRSGPGRPASCHQW